MKSTQGFDRHTLAAVLRVAVVVSLAAAVWSIYRHLPQDDTARRDGPTDLRVVLRLPPSSGLTAAGKIPVQLYPLNVAAARREYDSERRPGVSFEEFVTRRLGGKPPEGFLDERGEAVIPVTPGRWWVHVTVSGPEELTWRLPVNVSGREKVVELTPENVYTRAKSF